MNIQGASQASGLPAKTIRYYEMIGLVVADRQGNGYRQFADEHVRKLRFVRRARGIGFSVDDCRKLLWLYDGGGRCSPEAGRMAQGCLAEIDRKVESLRSIRTALTALMKLPYGAKPATLPVLRDLPKGLTESHQ